MSVDEIAVMKGSKCILQVRGVRPFLSDKYDITAHKNYIHLADYDPSLIFDIEEHIKVFRESKADLEKGEKKKPVYDRVVVEDDGLDTIAARDTDSALLPVDAVSGESPADAGGEEYSDDDFNADMEEEMSLPFG